MCFEQFSVCVFLYATCQSSFGAQNNSCTAGDTLRNTHYIYVHTATSTTVH